MCKPVGANLRVGPIPGLQKSVKKNEVKDGAEMQFFAESY
jgi:hypothetical protein